MGMTVQRDVGSKTARGGEGGGGRGEGVLTERLEQAIYFINLVLRVAPNSSSGGLVEGDPGNEITSSSFCSVNPFIRVDTVSSLMYKKNIITSPGCYYFHVNKQNFEL